MFVTKKIENTVKIMSPSIARWQVKSSCDRVVADLKTFQVYRITNTRGIVCQKYDRVETEAFILGGLLSKNIRLTSKQIVLIEEMFDMPIEELSPCDLARILLHLTQQKIINLDLNISKVVYYYRA